jgi:hypothetical protein
MKYAVEMGSSTTIHIPSFIKIGSGIHELVGGDLETHRQHKNCISLLSFSQKGKEIRLKMKASL